MTLKAVLFDLWGTLILDPEERSRPRQAWRTTSVQTILAEHGIDTEFESVRQALAAASVALTAMHDTGRDLDARGRVDLFAIELRRFAGPDKLPEAALPALEEAVTSMHPDLAPVLAEDAVETVAAVKAHGLKTALVSNAGMTTAPHLRGLLDAYNLSPHLDVLVFSDELGFAKPAPEIFAGALDALGVDAAATAFVGDAPHNDVYGAQSAGIFAVQIGSLARDGIKPQARIDRLDELLGVFTAHNLLDATAAIS